MKPPAAEAVGSGTPCDSPVTAAVSPHGEEEPAPLYQRLRTLPCAQVTCGYYDRTKGHGRHDTRVIKVLTVGGLDFPHAIQTARVMRHSTCVKTGKRTRETVYVITSILADQHEGPAVSDFETAMAGDVPA